MRIISYGIAHTIARVITDGQKLVKPFCHNVRLPERTMLFYRVTLLFVQYLVPVVIITVVYMRMALRLWGSHAPGNAQDSRDANLMRNKKKVRVLLFVSISELRLKIAFILDIVFFLHDVNYTDRNLRFG